MKSFYHLTLLLFLVASDGYEFPLSSWSCNIGNAFGFCAIAKAGCGIETNTPCIYLKSNSTHYSEAQSPFVPGITPGSTWIFSVHAKCELASGSPYLVVSGALHPARTSSNFETSLTAILENGWKRYDWIVRLKDDTTSSRMLLAMWYPDGFCYFDQISFSRLETRECSVSPYGQLSHLERVLSNGTYIAKFGGIPNIWSNWFNRIIYSTASWSTNVLSFSTGKMLILNHTLETPFTSTPSIELNINSVNGNGVIDVQTSNDGINYQWIQNISTTGKSFVLLQSINNKFVKLTGGGSSGSSVSLLTYSFSSKVIAPTRGDIIGTEVFLATDHTDTTHSNISLSIENNLQHTDNYNNSLSVQISSTSTSSSTISAHLEITPYFHSTTAKFNPNIISLSPGQSSSSTLTYHLSRGMWQIAKVVVTDGANTILKGRMFFTPTHYLLDATIGQLLQETTTSALWWCSSTNKVGLNRPAPVNPNPLTGKIYINAARYEFEAVQVVVRAKSSVIIINSVSIGQLTNSQGESLENVSIRRVWYVKTEKPSDYLGSRGSHFPDPLVPLQLPASLPANTNLPLWIVVYIDQNVTEGIYSGNINIQTNQETLSATLEVKVFNFTIPKHTKLKSWIGISETNIWKYHKMESENYKIKGIEYDYYLRSFSQHRLNPASPILYENPGATLVNQNGIDNWSLSFDSFISNHGRWYDDGTYNFTTYTGKLKGISFSTYSSVVASSITGTDGTVYAWGSPEHKRLFDSYALSLQNMLINTGMIDKVIFYTFDEPLESQYNIVKDQMQMIHNAAPKLRRFLTEQPIESLYGYVDVWCGIHAYTTPVIDKAHYRQSLGDEVWTYVSGWPETGHLDHYIDRPATDLRVWMWDVWQKKIDGILIWSGNWWQSGAYSDAGLVQNYYEDPSSTGFADEAGSNGNGVLYYPPFNFDTATKPLVNTTPVESIRLEMLRDGIEDWEYFTLLRNLLDTRSTISNSLRTKAESLLALPKTIIVDGFNYTFDSSEMDELRLSVAGVIESIFSTTKEDSFTAHSSKDNNKNDGNDNSKEVSISIQHKSHALFIFIATIYMWF